MRQVRKNQKPDNEAMIESLGFYPGSSGELLKSYVSGQ